MNISDVQKIITDRGWLAIHDLYFDNAFNLRVGSTGGCICMNKTTGSIYSLDKTGAIDSTVINNSIVRMPNNRIGIMSVISCTAVEHLQRANLSTFSQVDEFMTNLEAWDIAKGLSNTILPDLPKTVNDENIGYGTCIDKRAHNSEVVRPYVDGDTIDPDIEFISTDANGDMVVKKRRNNDFYTFFDDKNSTAPMGMLDKSVADEFYKHQAKFKSFIAALYGFNLSDLI